MRLGSCLLAAIVGCACPPPAFAQQIDQFLADFQSRWDQESGEGLAPAGLEDDVCIFEATGRVGGRIYSLVDVPGFGDMVVDAGGYRMIATDLLPTQLVQERLRMPTACYDWECRVPCLNGGTDCFVVADAYGNNAGFAQPIATMLAQIEAADPVRRHVYLGRTVTGVFNAGRNDRPRDVRLEFADGTAVEVGTLMVGIPGSAVNALDPASVLFDDAASEQVCQDLQGITYGSHNKVYIYYDDAWWNSKLGLMQGSFSDLTSKAPFSGRYHDGPQKCVIGQSVEGEPIYAGHKIPFGNCSGALSVYYRSAAPYYEAFMTDISKPVEVLHAGDGAEGDRLLGDVHAHLMEYHADLLGAKGLDPRDIPLPIIGVVANWNSDAQFTPNYGRLNSGTDESRASVRSPCANHDVFVANQDWGYKIGWAVGGLKMAELVLTREMGLAPPAWLNQSYFEDEIAALP